MVGSEASWGSDGSDAELVARARGGDRDALGALVRRHRPLADAVCRGVLQRTEVVEDVVQEALVVAVVGLERLRQPDRFGPWLCGIALNIARRWLRDAARRTGSTESIEAVDPGPGPEQAVLDADRTARIRRAVADLAPGQRDALALYYLAERSGPEVAAALAISATATKARLHKGRHALRHRLADERDDRGDTTMTTSIEMHVAEVRREPRTADLVRRHAIVLEEDGGDRRLPIYVGEPEATAVALRLTDADLPRPLTHELLTNVIGALGGRVTEVRVTRLTERVFFGEIGLDGPAGSIAIDARPSDAINLALLTGAPLRVERDVLTAAESCGGRALGADALTEGTQQIAAEFQASMAEAMRTLQDEP